MGEQFLKEGHLRWDSLGEYLATAIGFQELGQRTNNAKSSLLGDTLMDAIGKWLDNNKSPGRKVKQIDNRGSTSTLLSTGPRLWLPRMLPGLLLLWLWLIMKPPSPRNWRSVRDQPVMLEDTTRWIQSWQRKP